MLHIMKDRGERKDINKVCMDTVLLALIFTYVKINKVYLHVYVLCIYVQNNNDKRYN